MSARRRDEPVRLTRIYTRGGDKGETSLGDGARVPKLDCRIGAFGAVDELNSALGVVLAYLNRLSDFLFIAARWANADAGRDEPLWKPGG